MSILLRKVQKNLIHIIQDEFEDFAEEAINLIYSGNIQKIHASVRGSGSGDGGVDFFDLNTKTWFSVYGQKTFEDKGQKLLKEKIKSDFEKIINDVPGYEPLKWHFVCNVPLGHKHFKEIIPKQAIKFEIGEIFDLERISKKILETNQGKELLLKYKLIDSYDVVLEFKESTEKELKNESRPIRRININDEKVKFPIHSKINKKLKKDELEEVEFLYDEYLKNYYPLLLDGGLFSKKIPEIEKKYRENINKDRFKIKKEFYDLDKFNEFIRKKFLDNINIYDLIDKEEITRILLMPSEYSQKGCFYKQIANDFYNFENTNGNTIKLKILNNE